MGFEVGLHRIHAQIVTEQQESHAPEKLFRVEQGVLDLEDQLLLVLCAGQHDEAIKLLAAALVEDPKYDKTRLALAGGQLEAGHLVDARQTINGVSDQIRFDPPVKSLVARLELAEIANSDVDRATLENRISSNPNDLTTREQLGAVCFAAGENEAAMEQWLEIVRRGQGDIKESGRENLIRTFEVLGSQDQDVIRYRRFLSQALN